MCSFFARAKNLIFRARENWTIVRLSRNFGGKISRIAELFVQFLESISADPLRKSRKSRICGCAIFDFFEGGLHFLADLAHFWLSKMTKNDPRLKMRFVKIGAMGWGLK